MSVGDRLTQHSPGPQHQLTQWRPQWELDQLPTSPPELDLFLQESSDLVRLDRLAVSVIRQHQHLVLRFVTSSEVTVTVPIIFHLFAVQEAEQILRYVEDISQEELQTDFLLSMTIFVSSSADWSHQLRTSRLRNVVTVQPVAPVSEFRHSTFYFYSLHSTFYFILSR